MYSNCCKCCAIYSFRCACLPGICNTSSNECPSNKIARVVRPGNWTPGSCCDLIECIDGKVEPYLIF